MIFRIASKTVKAQEIRCRSQYDGPENVTTSGRMISPEGKYRKALRILLRRMDLETANPTEGTIDRCADVYRGMTANRLALLIAKASPMAEGHRKDPMTPSTRQMARRNEI